MDQWGKKFCLLFGHIFLVLTVIFFLVRVLPGDPVQKLLGEEATVEEIQKYKEQLGLNLSVGQQYLKYLKGFIKFDLGDSLIKKDKVLNLIRQSFFKTLVLALCSIILSTGLGFTLGILSARYRLRFLDRAIRIFSLLGISFPIFSLASLLVITFSIQLRLFPVSEWGTWRHLVLPMLTLAIPLSAVIMRVTRNRFLEDCRGQWVSVLRAKGLSEWSVTWRVAKASLPTVLNVVALQFSVVLAGTVITESIFDIPGMGMLLFEAIQNRDYPLVQAIILYITLIYLVIFHAVDFFNKKIDPRIIE